jgi:pyrophosphatase PpaX
MSGQGAGGPSRRSVTEWRAVLFDLDGTLADTVELILRSFRHTMAQHLPEVPSDARFLATIGKPLPVQLREFAADDDQLHSMRETYVSFQRGLHDQMVKPFPGARTVVSSLRARGVRVGIATSKAKSIATRTLDVCGFESVFDCVVCGDEVRHGKPHPEPVLRAMASLGIGDAPRRVLFVGDSPHDLTAGREAGVRTAAVAWGPLGRRRLLAEGPDYLVERMEDVLRLEP